MKGKAAPKRQKWREEKSHKKWKRKEKQSLKGDITRHRRPKTQTKKGGNASRSQNASEGQNARKRAPEKPKMKGCPRSFPAVLCEGPAPGWGPSSTAHREAPHLIKIALGAHVSYGVRAHAHLHAVDLKSTPLTTRANWLVPQEDFVHNLQCFSC